MSVIITLSIYQLGVCALCKCVCLCKHRSVADAVKANLNLFLFLTKYYCYFKAILSDLI